MKHLFLLIMLFFVLIIGCKPKAPTDKNPLPADTTSTTGDEKAEFEKVCHQAIKAINNKDEAALNALIHPEYGFYLIDNPGAYTVATRYQKFGLMNDTHKYILAQHSIDSCQLQQGTLPEFSCDTEDWDKKGCFWQEIKKYDGITKRCANYMPEYWEQPQPEAEMKIVKKAEASISRGVKSTEEQGYGFYLSRLNGKWYIVVINIVEPCSA